MEKLVYVILAAGVIGNIAVYYGLYRVRKSNKQHREQHQGHIPA